ncbi:hypothetical protein OKW41_004863 [Paraburkholderia sp. UCT70]
MRIIALEGPSGEGTGGEVWAFQPSRNLAPIALRDDGTFTNG